MPSDRLAVVIVALVANLILLVTKFIAFLLTGSPSMLAETYHSVSDSGNQVFLLIGIFYSRRRADQRHPFGYGKAIFFYSFLVSVLLFGIAGWESLTHGLSVLRAGPTLADGTITVAGTTLPAIYLAYGILLLTILLDGISYWKARQALDAETEERGWRGLRDAFQKTSDMPVLAVLTENAVAAIGASIALVAIFLSRQLDMPWIDAIGAVSIGVLLMVFAVALGIENKRLLLGEALTRRHEQPLERIIRDWDGVADIIDIRTVYFGPENVILTADIAFDPDLDTENIDERITAIEEALMAHEPILKKIYIEPEVE